VRLPGCKKVLEVRGEVDDRLRSSRSDHALSASSGRWQIVTLGAACVGTARKKVARTRQRARDKLGECASLQPDL
jgi:hypothetical protein